MARRQLSIESMKDLDDGRVSLAWQSALEQAVRDCLDRPALKKARKVTLVVEMVPIAQESDCEFVEGDFQVILRVPARRSRLHTFAVTTQGQLVFQDQLPDSPNQKTFDDQEKP